MRSPFKKRGLPDCGFRDGNPQQQTNATSTFIPVSSTTISHSNMVTEPMFPSRYQNNSNNPHTIDPPIAYPYAAQPYAAGPEQGESPGPVWEFNTGDNINMKGDQRGGNIRAANAVNGSVPPISLPQNGRFVFNTGKNYNVSGLQKSGNVEFCNVGYGAH